MENIAVVKLAKLRQQFETLRHNNQSIKSAMKLLESVEKDERIPRILAILDDVIDDNEVKMKELRNTNPAELKAIAIYSTNILHQWLKQNAEVIDPAKYQHGADYYIYGSVPVIARNMSSFAINNTYIVSLDDKEKIVNKLRELGQKFTSRSIIPYEPEYVFFSDFAGMPHRVC